MLHRKSFNPLINGIDQSLTAKLVPSQPTETCAWMDMTMVDLNFLEHWKDIPSDNLGTWMAMGMKTLFYTTSLDRDGYISLIASKDTERKLMLSVFDTSILIQFARDLKV